jgi:hypothetical protein
MQLPFSYIQLPIYCAPYPQLGGESPYPGTGKIVEARPSRNPESQCESLINYSLGPFAQQVTSSRNEILFVRRDLLACPSHKIL